MQPVTVDAVEHRDHLVGTALLDDRITVDEASTGTAGRCPERPQASPDGIGSTLGGPHVRRPHPVD